MSKTGIALKTRDSIIDTSRGLALILMVIGHLGMKVSIVQFIYSFHMPLFFFVSGMTAKRNNSDSFVVYVNKRIRRVLVPYMLFGLIFAAPGVKEYLLVATGTRQGLVEAASLTPLWFLPCIFITDLMLNLILRYLINPDRKMTILLGGGITVLLSILGVVITRFFPYAKWIPCGTNISFIVIPFSYLGWCFKNSNLYKDIKNIPSTTRIMISVFIILVPLFLYKYNLPSSVTEGFNHVELSIGQCGNYLLFLVNAILGSLGCVIISTVLDCKFLRKVGQSTIACLGTHGIIISTIYSNDKIYDVSWIKYSIAFLVVIISIIPINYIFEKYVPNIVGRQ